jgi:hypothetical protein
MLLSILKNKSEQELAQDNVRLNEQANTYSRQLYMYNGDMSKRFYEDEQLTREELQTLDAAGMPTFTINRMTPVINMLLYFATSNPPRWKAIGRGTQPDDVDMAAIHDRIIDYTFKISDGKSKHGFISEDCFVRGCGNWSIFVDKDADQGDGEVLLGNPDERFVYIDPASRDFLGRDAGFQQVAKNMTKSALKAIYPDKEAEIEASSGNQIVHYFRDADGYIVDSQDEGVSFIANAISPVNGEWEDVVPYFYTRRLVKVKMWKVTQRVPADPKVVEQIQTMVKEQVGQMEAEFTVVRAEAEKAFSQQVEAGQMIQSRKDWELQKMDTEFEGRIKAEGDKMFSMLQEEKTKVEKYVVDDDAYKELVANPDVVETILDSHSYWENREHVVASCGADTFLESKLYPWTHYTLIRLPYLHRGTPYPVGIAKYLVGKQREINKGHQIVIHHANLSSNPQTYMIKGSISNKEEWKQQKTLPGGILEVNPGFELPKDKLPAQLNSAFFTLVQEGKNDLPYIAGVNDSAVVGTTERNDEPFRTTAMRDEQSTRGLRKWVSNILEPCMEHIGIVHLEVCQNVYDTNKIFRIVGETDIVEVEINKPKFDYQTGELVGRYHDYQTAKFDIQFVAGSTFPVNKEMQEARTMSLVEKGMILPEHGLIRLEIENKDQILQDISTVKRLEGAVQERDDQIKKMEHDAESMEAEIVNTKIQLKVAVGAMEIKKDTLETEAQQIAIRDKSKLAFDQFKSELQLILKQIQADAKIKSSKTSNKTEK